MSKKDEEIIEEAQKHFKNIRAKQERMRAIGKECRICVADAKNMWDDGALDERENAGRPCISINKLSKPLDYIANKHYENQKSPKVKPSGDEDQPKAKVINALFKKIENSGKMNGKAALNNGYYHSGLEGYGYWRVVVDFKDERSFDQDIYYREIDNPDTVYMDNEDVCIITEKMSRDDFKAKYPDAETDSWEDLEENEFLLNDNEIIIAEYWKRIKTPARIYLIQRPVQNEDQIIQLQDVEGSRVMQGEMETAVVTEEELKEISEYEVLQERETELIGVKQYLISPSEILDTTDWDGKYIPIVGTFGRKYIDDDGMYFYKGWIWDSIPANKLLNYVKSQKAEVLQQAPKNKVVGIEGQFAGHEGEWANHDQEPYLEVKPVVVNGQLAPLPTITPPPQFSPALAEMTREFEQDIKDTHGVQDPSLGMYSPGASGKAVLATQRATDLGTSQHEINFNNALIRTAMIVVDLIPHVYNKPRTMEIMGEDMREEVVKINEAYLDNNGKEMLYDLSKTIDCDIVLQAAHSAPTRRQENFDNLLEVGKLIPQSGAVMGDIVASQLDMEKSEELSKRLKAIIPPQVFERIKELDEEAEGKVSPERIQIKKMDAMIQQMQMQLIKTTEDAKRLFQENEQLKKRDDQIKIDVEKIRTSGDLEQERMRQDGATKREYIKKD